MQIFFNCVVPAKPVSAASATFRNWQRYAAFSAFENPCLWRTPLLKSANGAFSAFKIGECCARHFWKSEVISLLDFHKWRTLHSPIFKKTEKIK
jgi:hypothetical protein